MLKKDWNPNGLILRDYIWVVLHTPAIDKIPIKPGDDVLEVGIRNFFVLTNLDKPLPNITLNTINLSDLNLTIPKEKQEGAFKTNYDVIYQSIRRRPQVHPHPTNIFEFNYLSLKPGGRFSLTIPTYRNSIYENYKALIESKAYPTLDTDTILFDEGLCEEVKNSIQQYPFKDIIKETVNAQMTLPNLQLFNKLLHDISFYYKKEMSSKLNDAVIESQVEIFDKYCEKNHQGEYILECELDLIHAIK